MTSGRPDVDVGIGAHHALSLGRIAATKASSTSSSIFRAAVAAAGRSPTAGGPTGPASSSARSAMYLVAIDVANRDGALRPGMSAVVDLPVVSGRDTLAVPNAALASRSDGETKLALVSKGHGPPEAIAVAVGVANDDLTEVMGPGIAAGRLVVTDASPSTCLVGPLHR